MIAIVNVTENWGIGFQNRLLVSISADLKRFRRLTEGKTVVLGRKTLETFPGGRPLKNRRNLILSTDPTYFVQGAEVCHSLEELMDRVGGLEAEEVCVIGGARVYELLLPYCTRVHVTKTLCSLPADCFFPNLDSLPDWKIEKISPVEEENGRVFQYVDYVNLNPQKWRISPGENMYGL